MWRPDLSLLGRRPSFVLRLGQSQFQLWSKGRGGLGLVAACDSSGMAFDQHAGMSIALTALCRDLPTGSSVQAVVDSKWMPAIQLLTGAEPLRTDQIHGLAAHRLASLYGDTARQWHIQTSYVTGDRVAIGFGCPKPLMDAITHGLQSAVPSNSSAIALTGVQPSFAWVCNHIWRSSFKRREAWLVLAEHDRSLMMKMHRGRLSAFHGAGPVLSRTKSLKAQLQGEVLRCGIQDGEGNYCAVSFEPIPSVSGQTEANEHWRVLAQVEALS